MKYIFESDDRTGAITGIPGPDPGYMTFSVTVDDDMTVLTVEGPPSIKSDVEWLMKDEHHGSDLAAVVRAYSRTHNHRRDEDDGEVEKGDGQPPSKGVVVVAIPSNQAGIAVDGGLVPSEVHATLG